MFSYGIANSAVSKTIKNQAGNHIVRQATGVSDDMHILKPSARTPQELCALQVGFVNDKLNTSIFV
jgi:hypothetical protein